MKVVLIPFNSSWEVTLPIIRGTRASRSFDKVIYQTRNRRERLINRLKKFDGLLPAAKSGRGFSYAGQSCISVQRVYGHTDIYAGLVEELIPRVQALKVGDPLDEATDVGPLIDQSSAGGSGTLPRTSVMYPDDRDCDGFGRTHS